MKLIIANDITVIEPNAAIIDYCMRVLTIPNPAYVIALRLKRNVRFLDQELKLYARVGDNLILPYGTLKDIWALRDECDYELQFHEFRGNNLAGHINLYDYQEKALDALKSGKNGILEAPCGSGKTQVGLALIKALGGRALWLTHTKKLLTQSKARAESVYKGDFGTITEGQVNIGKDITFATVQTMRAIDPAIYRDAFDIVIVDECHHAVGSPTKIMQFYKVLSNCNARYKYGLSATLSRSDGLITSAYSIIGRKLHTITTQEVGNKIIKALHIKQDIDFTYPMPSYCDADGTTNYAKLIDMLSNHLDRNDYIVDTTLKYHNLGKKQLILCTRIAQVKALATALATFCHVSMITGTTKESSRGYDADVIVATFQLAREGLDIPHLDVVHFAIPQKNKAIVKQSAGRVERNIVGKEQPLIIDYVDTTIPYCVKAYHRRRIDLKSKIK